MVLAVPRSSLSHFGVRAALGSLDDNQDSPNGSAQQPSSPHRVSRGSNHGLEKPQYECYWNACLLFDLEDGLLVYLIPSSNGLIRAWPSSVILLSFGAGTSSMSKISQHHYGLLQL